MSQPINCPREAPFFIVGNPRSGTTLLAFVLSSHSRLHVSGETGFLPRLTKYAEGELSRGRVSEVIETITRLNREWRGLVEDEDRFYAALPSKSLPCLLDTLYRLKTREFKAGRWGEKTPSYVGYILQIDQIFPNAQFIHVVRDGRDSALSAQKKWGSQKWYMDNYYLLKNWAVNVENGRRAGERLGPERYLEIKYETLVQKSSETIKTICAFLHEEFSPQLLEHSELAPKVVRPTSHTEALRPINTQSVERWKQGMTIFDRKMANELIEETLLKFDYPLAVCEPLTRLERTKLLIKGVRFHLLDFLRGTLYKAGVLALNRGKQRRVDKEL